MLNRKVQRVVINGGLGNQMFQYAFLLALREKGHKVVMDTSYYDYVNMHNGYELGRVFGIKEKTTSKQGLHIIWLRFLNRYRPKCLYRFDTLHYDESVLITPKHYLFGYWQDERYFQNIKDDVRKAFSFKDIDEENQNLAFNIKNCNSVSMHIRRGDYAAFGMTIIGEDYYCRAVKYIKSKVDNPVFYIFSDDETVAKTISDKCGIEYHIVNINKGMESYKDMYLMTQCKHNITANSSFSWWGAWLNGNKGKIVVAPKEWNTNNPSINPQPTSWVLI